MSRPQLLLVHARLAVRRQEDKVLAAGHLDVDVFVVVLVQRRHGTRVADPQVDGLGLALQGDAREGYVLLDVAEEGGVLVSEVVVFFKRWQVYSLLLLLGHTKFLVCVVCVCV